MEAAIKPTKTQQQAWDLLLDDRTRYLLFGGAAGGGKTFLGCEWLLVMALGYSWTRWFMARNELKELRDSTLRTFYKVMRHHGIEPDALMKYNGMDHFIQFNNGSRIDLLDIKTVPSDPFFERLGSMEFTGGFIDEAGPIEFMAFDVLKTRIGRCENDRHGLTPKILLCSNPSKGWLYGTFYLPHKQGTLPAHMAFVRSLPTDNEYLEKGYLDHMQTISTKVMRERLLLGLWEYSDSEGCLVEYEAIADAFSGVVGAKVKTGHPYITCDVARYGRDSTVIILWNGLRAEKILKFSDLPVTETANRISTLRSQFNVPLPNICIDQDGVGGGVCDLLPGTVSFMNGGKPVHRNPKDQNYSNLKSQCYFRLAELINSRELFINCDAGLRECITQELEQVRMKNLDSDGKLAVIAKRDVKDAIGRSPDITDALMMRTWYEVGGGSMGLRIIFPDRSSSRPTWNGRSNYNM